MLPIEQQVCSLELAKKLKELGLKQESIFVWEYYDYQCYSVKYVPYAIIPDEYNKFQWYSAFTVAELGEILPILFTRRILINEADARAKMLIHLISNNLVSQEWKDEWLIKS